MFATLLRSALVCTLVLGIGMPQPTVFVVSALVLIFLTGQLVVVSLSAILFSSLYTTTSDSAYLAAFFACALVVTLARSKFTFA
jgi:hypothetical protein